MIKKIKEKLINGIGTDFPGAHFCFIDGQKITCDFVGYKELEPNKVELIGNEIYDIASISKIISTTSIILKLIEQNKLSYYTKVQDILPQYKHKETTIEMLLTHTSGLPAMIDNGYKIIDKDELIKGIYNQELIYEPNQKIVYSDVGFILLGFIIEKVMNNSIDKVAEQLIFTPLMMNDTSYNPEISRCAPTEFRDDKLFKGLHRGVVHDERSYILNGKSGHAGVFSTSYDISLYIRSILNDEILFNDKTKEKIFSTIIEREDMNGKNLTRTIGFNKYENMPENLNNLIYHTGFTGCNFWIDIKNKQGFVLLSNAVHPYREMNKIFRYRDDILELFYNNNK